MASSTRRMRNIDRYIVHITSGSRRGTRAFAGRARARSADMDIQLLHAFDVEVERVLERIAHEARVEGGLEIAYGVGDREARQPAERAADALRRRLVGALVVGRLHLDGQAWIDDAADDLGELADRVVVAPDVEDLAVDLGGRLGEQLQVRADHVLDV